MSLGLAGLARWEEFRPIWYTWWLGDTTGALLVGPLLLVWLQEPSAEPSRQPGSHALPFSRAWSLRASSRSFSVRSRRGTFPSSFSRLPFLVAIAFRYGVREVVTANALLSAIADSGPRGASHSHG